MNFKKLPYFLGALVAVGALLVWDDIQTKKDNKIEASQNLLIPFHPANVASIEYYDETLAQPKFTLTRAGSDWEVTSPVESKSSNKDVENLLETLSKFKYTKKHPAQTGWDEYGLGAKARTIKLAFTNDKAPITLHVGNNVPIGYSTYFRLSNNKEVYVGSQYLATATGKQLYDFRDKSFTNFDPEVINEFVYKTPGQETIKITKTEDKFAMVAPVKSKVDEFQLGELFRGIKEAKATMFLDTPSPEMVSSFAAGKADIELSWTTTEGTQKSLLLTTHQKQFYATFDPSKTVYGVSDEFQYKIAKRPYDLRDKRLLSIDSATVERVKINGAFFKKKDKKWLNTDGEEIFSIGALLIDLEYIKTKKFISLADMEVSDHMKVPPKHEIELMTPDSSTFIQVYGYSNPELYLLRSDTTVGLVEKSIIETGVSLKEHPEKVPEEHGHDHNHGADHDHATHDSLDEDEKLH